MQSAQRTAETRNLWIRKDISSSDVGANPRFALLRGTADNKQNVLMSIEFHCLGASKSHRCILIGQIFLVNVVLYGKVSSLGSAPEPGDKIYFEVTSSHIGPV